jgi:hypothetical protein
MKVVPPVPIQDLIHLRRSQKAVDYTMQEFKLALQIVGSNG